MIFLEPFKFPILLEKLDIDSHNIIREYVLSLYNDNDNNTKEGNFYGTGFTTTFFDDYTGHLNNVKEFSELKEKILFYANQYLTNTITELHIKHPEAKLHFSKIEELIIKRMWFNVNPQHGYQGNHHHADYLLAGTYYIDVPENSRTPEFSNPSAYSYLKNQCPIETHLTLSNFRIDTKSKDLLIWPGHLSHEVKTNKSIENRITASFCIDWKSSHAE